MQLGNFPLSLAVKDITASRVRQADEASTGPAGFMLEVPHGNQIRFDQHA